MLANRGPLRTTRRDAAPFPPNEAPRVTPPNLCRKPDRLASLVAVASPGLCSAAVIVSTGGPTAAETPAFWIGSYYPVSRQISRAFPFTGPAGDPLSVERLRVAAHRFDGGGAATFTIHRDAADAPSETLGRFNADGLDATQRVHELVYRDAPLLLSPGETYWLVAETPSGEFRWNLAAGVLGNGVIGPTAFRRPREGWTPRSGNLAAYELLGRAAPEPSALLLLAVAPLAAPRKRRAQPSASVEESPSTSRAIR